MTPISKAPLLPLLVLSIAGTGVACSNRSSGADGSDGSIDAAASADAAVVLDASDGDAGESTLPTPIRYVFVVVKENRTFDNYFATFPGANGAKQATLANGTVVSLPDCPVGALPANLNHTHAAALTAWANGAMNGFDTANGAPLPDGGLETFCTYPQGQIPNYWSYAHTFTLCDAFFSASLAPSFPGHFATATAQTPALDNPVGPWGCDPAFGIGSVSAIDQSSCRPTGTVSPACFAVPSVVDALPPSLTWRVYGVTRPNGDMLTPFESVRSIGGAGGPLAAHFRDVSRLFADLAAGDLANITYLNTFPLDAQNRDTSEHPPDDPCPGENYSVRIISAIMQGPHWRHVAILLSWDDWGGFYDHVAPSVTACANPGPFANGFRLPLLIISPFSKPGVFHGKSEQGSIPRLIEDLFGLPRMASRDANARDAIAGDLLPAFDFNQPPLAPLILPQRTCP